MAECWAIARIVQTSPHPTTDPCFLQVLAPWRIFLGYTSSIAPIFTNDIVSSSQLNATPNELPLYFIPSTTDVIFCVVGPPNSSVANIRVQWGTTPTPLRLITTDTTSSFTLCTSNWSSAVLPLTVSGNPPMPNYKGNWKSIEVHTNIDRKEEEGLNMRLEHHDARRVPPSPCWRLSSKGGYSTTPPAHLEQQAQASIAWQFAVRAVLRDSGWGKELNRKYGGYIRLMGFETNNPLHDDHSGKGAHWHLASRKCPFEHTPHFYLKPDGTIDCDTTLQKEPIGWSYGVFAVRLRPVDGGLSLGPVVTLCRSSSKHHLHVRQSLQGDRDPVALWHDENEGNKWMVIKRPSGHVSLCSTRSWQFLHVRASMRQVGNPVVQYHDTNENDQGSEWMIDAAGNVSSVRSGLYLAAPEIAEDRKSVIQSTTTDAWEITSSTSCNSSYVIHIRAATINGVEVEILKDTNSWCKMKTFDNTKEGKLIICTQNSTEDSQQTINYDPLTGKVVSV